MGNTNSVPGREESPRMPLPMGRNKLSKPRVGSYSSRRELSCLPPVSASAASSAKAASRAVRQSQFLPPLYAAGHPDTPESSSREAYAHPRQSSLVGSIAESSIPLARYESHRRSTLGSQFSRSGPDPLISTDIAQVSHPPVGILRRRSQIFAAPPATATRRQTIGTQDIELPTSQLFALDLSERDRAQTPSGYSVLGGFKRGSLRIVNGSASPAPSTHDVRPKRRNTSPAHLNGSCYSLHATPTPQLSVSAMEPQDYFTYEKLESSYSITTDKLSVEKQAVRGDSGVGTPLSFCTALKVPSEPDIENFFASLPSPSKVYSSSQIVGDAIDVSPPVPTYDDITTIAIPEPSHTEFRGPLMPNPDSDSPPPVTVNSAEPGALDGKISVIPRKLSISSSIYSDAPSLTHRRPFEQQWETEYRGVVKPSRRPSCKGGTDSGYCSTGSIRSWGTLSRNSSKGEPQSSKDDYSNLPSRSFSRAPDQKTSRRSSAPQSDYALRCTDEYRLRSAKEGPEPVLKETKSSHRARKLSISSPFGSEPSLRSMRSIRQKIRAVVSSNDLRSKASTSPFLASHIGKRGFAVSKVLSLVLGSNQHQPLFICVIEASINRKIMQLALSSKLTIASYAIRNPSREGGRAILRQITIQDSLDVPVWLPDVWKAQAFDLEVAVERSHAQTLITCSGTWGTRDAGCVG
ncbi:hypothetical protein BDZ91DRAFT_763952 [Kalaharituber pfeilii]|nr:hypothetical protein BDZ91DRAFT_763952 [Kalaharituber pfeilii]